MIPINWSVEMVRGIIAGWIAKVPIRAHGQNDIGGEYTLRIVARPEYCDRGDWKLFADGTGDSRLDFADGFPRYFFGDIDQAKEQFQRWVNKRKECQINAETQTETSPSAE